MTPRRSSPADSHSSAARTADRTTPLAASTQRCARSWVAPCWDCDRCCYGVFRSGGSSDQGRGGGFGSPPSHESPRTPGRVARAMSGTRSCTRRSLRTGLSIRAMNSSSDCTEKCQRSSGGAGTSPRASVRSTIVRPSCGKWTRLRRNCGEY